MSIRDSLSRHNLIISLLRKKPSTLIEILNYLSERSQQEGYNYEISDRTLSRDLEAIRSLYNIDIQYNRSKRSYVIESEQSEANDRILEAFDITNALNFSERLTDYIFFEKRKPKGTENLYGILHAIKNRYQIEFTYQAFWSDSPDNRVVEPYGLKEFNNRWYIVSNDRKDNQIKSFALDRLSNLEITTKRFKFPANFSVAAYYKYCFGIMSPNAEKPEEVILSFNPHKGKYIKSLPLHETQEVLVDNETELRVRLTVFVTHDFKMELLSHGKEVRVIGPQMLIDELRETLKDALQYY